mgnify:CR=1 FL=1
MTSPTTPQPLPFLIGCNGRGAQRSSKEQPISLAELPIMEQFRLVKETGVFDYFDRIPLRANFGEYVQAIEKYDLPVHSASWFYRLGEDEALLADNLRICREIGAQCHNIMTFSHHRDGHAISNAEVVDHYLQVYDEGMRLGVEPSFELHVNMWTEEFLRIREVAEQVQARGIPFHFTLDYSHVNFKIGNSAELELSGVRAQAESGALVLDPFEENSLCDQWLEMNIVRWAQLRAWLAPYFLFMAIMRKVLRTGHAMPCPGSPCLWLGFHRLWPRHAGLRCRAACIGTAIQAFLKTS